jgi:hypothetical protein
MKNDGMKMEVQLLWTEIAIKAEYIVQLVENSSKLFPLVPHF